MKRILSLLLAFVSLSLFSDEMTDQMTPEAEASYSGPPSLFIVGDLNAKNGDYIERHVDIELNAAVPLTFERFAHSQFPGSFPYIDLWSNNHQCLLEVEEDKRTRIISVVGHNGGGVQFTANSDFTGIQLKDALQHGWTNAGAGVTGGKTDIRNYVVERVNDEYFKVTMGDGSVKEFKRIPDSPEWNEPWRVQKRSTWLVLMREKLPSGHYLHYRYAPTIYVLADKGRLYDRHPQLASIELLTPNEQKVLGWIHFEGKGDDPLIIARTSDGQEVKYHRNFRAKSFGPAAKVNDHAKCKKSAERVLTRVENSFSYPIDYEYSYTAARGCEKYHRISYVKKPGGRSLHTDYCISDDRPCKAPNAGRAVLHAKPPYLASTDYVDYLYHPEQRLHIVCHIEAEAYSKKYIFTKDMRYLFYIQQCAFKKLDHPYRNYYMTWGDKEPNTGRLQEQWVSTPNNKAHYLKQRFAYDKAGNITARYHAGNLTNTSKTPELYYESFTYSEDGFNNLLSHTDLLGLKKEYQYKPGTNLPTARFEGGSRRHFYEYDEDHLLIATIDDDGSSKDPEDLSGVTERHITRYTLRQESPGLGLPEWEREYTGDGQLITQKFNRYNSRNLVEYQELTDANGNLLEFIDSSYNAMGSVNRVRTRKGESLYDYDEMGNVTYTKDPTGSEIFKKYDLDNHCIEERHVLGDEERVTTYEYDCLGAILSKTDYLGNRTSYTYDPYHRKATEESPPLRKTVIGKKNAPQIVNEKTIKTLSYDIMDNVCSETVGGQTPQTKEFNNCGRLSTIRYADGTTERFEYLPSGKYLRKHQRDGSILEYDTDVFGRHTSVRVLSPSRELVDIKKYRFNALHLLEEEDNAGSIKTYSYDTHGHLINVVHRDPQGSWLTETTYAYDVMDRCIQETNWSDEAHQDGVVTLKRFEPLQEEVKIQTLAGTLSHWEIKNLDAQGRVLEQQVYGSNGWQSTQYEYNIEGNVKRTIDPQGNVSSLEVIKTTNTYGQGVRKEISTDPLGIKTIKTFDVLGRVASISVENLSHIDYEYDDRGNIIKEDHHRIQNGVVIGHYICGYIYNALDEKIQITQAQGTPLARTLSMTYIAGQLKTLTKPDGICLEYTYNALGGISSLKAVREIPAQKKKPATFSTHLSYTYTYDSSHHITTVTDDLTGKQFNRHSDILGRLVDENSIHRNYDGLSNLLQLTSPLFGDVTYSYEGNLFTQMQRNNYTHHCSYASNGLLVEENDIHGNRIHYDYDVMDRLTKYDAGSYLYKLEYDPLGRLVKRYLEDGWYIKEQAYAYDGLSQITQDDDKAYEYDSLNNALVRDNIPYKINELNQVTYDGTFTYEYDTNGNRVAKTANGQRTTYTYDPLNRLIAVDGRSYTYDPFNRLISYDDRELVYDDDKEIGSISEGHLEYRILRPGVESEVGNILCMEVHNKVYSTLRDHLGHCVALLDEDGIEEVYEYSAFKLERVYKGNDSTEPLSPWGFCSKRHLPTEAFINFGRRVYDMNLGRWLTQDPLGHADGPNMYAYVHNNALNTIDEFGLYDSGELWQQVNQRIAYTQAIGCGFVAGVGQGICGISADICGMAAYMDSGFSYANPFCQSFSPSQSSCQQGRRSLDDVSAAITRLCRPDSDDPSIQRCFQNAKMVGTATTEAAMFVLPGGAALSLASKTTLVAGRALSGVKAISYTRKGSQLRTGLLEASKNKMDGLKVFNSLEDKFGEGYKSVSVTCGKYLPVGVGRKLEAISHGNWNKIYEAGFLNGSPIEVHYFYDSISGKYVNPFIKSSGWKSKDFKELNMLCKP